MTRYALITALLCGQALADSSSLNLALPNMGSTYGTDSIRAGDLDCKNSIGFVVYFGLDP